MKTTKQDSGLRYLIGTKTGDRGFLCRNYNFFPGIVSGQGVHDTRIYKTLRGAQACVAAFQDRFLVVPYHPKEHSPSGALHEARLEEGCVELKSE